MHFWSGKRKGYSFDSLEKWNQRICFALIKTCILLVRIMNMVKIKRLNFFPFQCTNVILGSESFVQNGFFYHIIKEKKNTNSFNLDWCCKNWITVASGYESTQPFNLHVCLSCRFLPLVTSVQCSFLLDFQFLQSYQKQS